MAGHLNAGGPEALGIFLMLAGFLGIFTCQDLKTREIPVPLLIAFLAACLLVRAAVFPAAPAVILAGTIPGLCLLAAARLSRGAVGAGDALVILGLGLLLGAAEAVLLFLGGLFFLFLPAAVLFFRAGRRRTELPYIPFLFVFYVIREVSLWAAGVFDGG